MYSACTWLWFRVSNCRCSFLTSPLPFKSSNQLQLTHFNFKIKNDKKSKLCWVKSKKLTNCFQTWCQTVKKIIMSHRTWRKPIRKGCIEWACVKNFPLNKNKNKKHPNFAFPPRELDASLEGLEMSALTEECSVIDVMSTMRSLRLMYCFKWALNIASSTSCQQCAR